MAEECIFCGIISGSIPASKVYEDNSTFAFLDINPRNPGHTLVIPKVHAETIFDVSQEDAITLFTAVKNLAGAIKQGTNADGISISSSNGRAAGQIVPHLHFHIIPRFSTEGPPGLEGILPVKKLDEASMEQVAEQIKSNLGLAPAPKQTEPVKEETAPEPSAETSEPSSEPVEKKEKRDDFEDLDNIDFDL